MVDVTAQRRRVINGKAPPIMKDDVQWCAELILWLSTRSQVGQFGFTVVPNVETAA